MLQSLILVVAILVSNSTFAQKQKINLEDVKIQGEGQRGAQINLGKNDRTDLEKHLTIRRNFRKDIVDALPHQLDVHEKKKKKENRK